MEGAGTAAKDEDSSAERRRLQELAVEYVPDSDEILRQGQLVLSTCLLADYCFDVLLVVALGLGEYHGSHPIARITIISFCAASDVC